MKSSFQILGRNYNDDTDTTNENETEGYGWDKPVRDMIEARRKALEMGLEPPIYRVNQPAHICKSDQTVHNFDQLMCDPDLLTSANPANTPSPTNEITKKNKDLHTLQLINDQLIIIKRAVTTLQNEVDNLLIS